LVAGVTAALLPALHIAPIEFDPSYYHDRYATAAIAIACAFLPMTMGELAARSRSLSRVTALASLPVLVAWLALGIFTISTSLPLWRDEALLWKWVLATNPGYFLAEDNVLVRYLERGALDEARPVAAAVSLHGRNCT